MMRDDFKERPPVDRKLSEQEEEVHEEKAPAAFYFTCQVRR